MKNLNKIPLERIYLWLAIPIGLFFVFINPPFFGVPDEPAHYFKSLSLAQGSVTCSGEPIMVPVNYASFPDDIKPVKIKGEERKKMSGKKIIEAITLPASEDSVELGPSICGTSPIGHLTQALGLKIGLLFDAPPLIAFYLGRLLTLVLVVSAIYFAIRIAPFGKPVFMLMGLLPSAVQQLSSYSYDAPHIALILLFLAYLFRLANNDDKLMMKQGWLLLVLSLAALNVKPGYFLLCFLVFVLSKAKFETSKKYWVYSVGFVAVNVIFFLLLRLSFSGGDTNVFAEGVDPRAQAWSVMWNPMNFVYVVFNSIYDGFSFYFETFFLKPGWINTSLPEPLYVFMLIGMILILRSKDEMVNLDVRQRLVLFGVFLVQFFLVFLSMYLVWTKVGNERVVGVQGRYFLAIVPLLIFSFYKSRFRFRSEWIRNNIAVALVVFFLITFIFTFQNILGLYYKDLSSYF